MKTRKTNFGCNLISVKNTQATKHIWCFQNVNIWRAKVKKHRTPEKRKQGTVLIQMGNYGLL